MSYLEPRRADGTPIWMDRRLSDEELQMRAREAALAAFKREKAERGEMTDVEALKVPNGDLIRDTAVELPVSDACAHNFDQLDGDVPQGWYFTYFLFVYRLHDIEPAARIDYVKEKFGHLRISTSARDPATSEAIHALKDRTIGETDRTCSICARPGSWFMNGDKVCRVRCEHHRDLPGR